MEERKGPGAHVVVEYTKKIEACGLSAFRCCFCQRSLDDEASMRDHVEAHSVVRVRVNCARRKRFGDKKLYHREFPAWRGTTATDSHLRNWLAEARRDSSVSPREILIPVACVLCEDKDLCLHYCAFCGFESDPSAEMQQSHFFEKHVEFVVKLSRTRLFYC